jgi:glycosyltransferase involved in cell wall biosynthesis
LRNKILHVVNISFVLPYYLGDQITYFCDKNFSISIACSDSIDFFKFCNEHKANPIPLKITRKFDLFNDIKSIFKLFFQIRKHNFDIVIGHTPKGGLISMVASYFANTKKRIYFRHGLMFETSKGFKRYILITIEKLTGLLATDVICVSNSVLEVSNKLNLSSPTKNKILNLGTCNGVDSIKKFNPNKISFNFKKNLKKQHNISENDIVIGFVGRIVKDKGIEELIVAWKNIILSYTNIKLFLVGPFETRDSIDLSIQEYIINEKSIIYVGEQSDTVLYYSTFDIFILPSYREGFPTVVLEASSMQLPVITTKNTGCIDSIQENITGIYCDISSNTIINSLKYYIDNPVLRKNHGINGRDFVINNFNQNLIWKEIEKIITSVN